MLVSTSAIKKLSNKKHMLKDIQVQWYTRTDLPLAWEPAGVWNERLIESRCPLHWAGQRREHRMPPWWTPPASSWILLTPGKQEEHKVDKTAVKWWKRHKKGVRLTGFVPLWKWRRRLAAFKSPSGVEPCPLRRGGGVRGQDNTPVCFSLCSSVTLEVCDTGGWVCYFLLLLSEYVRPSPQCFTHLYHFVPRSLTPLISLTLFRLQRSFFYSFLLPASGKKRKKDKGLFDCVLESDRKEVVRSTTVTCRSKLQMVCSNDKIKKQSGRNFIAVVVKVETLSKFSFLYKKCAFINLCAIWNRPFKFVI